MKTKHLDNGDVRETIRLKAIARTIKALIGVCFRYSGFQTTVNLCIKLNVIDKSIKNQFKNYTKKLNDPNFMFQWEQVNRQMNAKQQLAQSIKLNRLEKQFGYKFNNVTRGIKSLVHPSVSMEHRLFYRWNDTIGDVLLDLIFYEQLFEIHPEMTQKSLNRLFDHITINNTFAMIGFELKLPYITDFYIKDLHIALQNKEEEEKEKNKDYRNLITSIVRNIVGAIWIDCGFDFVKIKNILKLRIKNSIKKIEVEEPMEFLKTAIFVPRAIEARAFSSKEVSELKIREFYQTTITIRNKENQVYFAFGILTKRPVPPELDIFEIYPFSNGLEDATVKVSYSTFNKKRNFKLTEYKLIEDFQEDFFTSIFIPVSCVRERIGPAVKKYFIIPMRRTSKNRPWVIDWILIRSITDQEDNFANHNIISQKNTNTDTKTMTQQLPEINNTIKFFSNSVYMTEKHELISHVERDEYEILNLTSGQNLHKTSQMSMSSIPYKRIQANVDECKLMPYTYGYVFWIRTLPSILFKFECQLLAEDIREYYNLPKSIPNESLLMAMTGSNALQDLYCIETDAISNAIFKYLFTIDFYFIHKNSKVGRLSSSRNRMYSNRAYADKDNIDFLKGHLINVPFMPYKAKTPWHNPAVDPYILIQRDVTENLMQLQLSDDEDVFDDVYDDTNDDNGNNRVLSYVVQKIPFGMMDKHVKSISAVSYLYGGIEAAHQFLYLVGALRYEKYPIQEPGKSKFINKKLSKLEKVIGYEFKDKNLLERAFIHSSIDESMSYDVLEFLGDAAIELINVTFIF